MLTEKLYYTQAQKNSDKQIITRSKDPRRQTHPHHHLHPPPLRRHTAIVREQRTPLPLPTPTPACPLVEPLPPPRLPTPARPLLLRPAGGCRYLPRTPGRLPVSGDVGQRGNGAARGIFENPVRSIRRRGEERDRVRVTMAAKRSRTRQSPL